MRAQVAGNFSKVNSVNGYTLNGGAPNNQVLCGNGTFFVAATACGSVSIPNYQTITINGGGGLPARATLNFDSNFTGNDTSPSTTIHLASTISVTSTNSNAVGGVGLAGLCQTTGTGCPAFGVTGSISQQLGNRAIGTTYTNGHGTAMYVSGYATTSSGGNTSAISCDVNGIRTFSAQYNATVSGGQDGFVCGMIPPGGTYVVTAGTSGGSVNLASWSEFVF